MFFYPKGLVARPSRFIFKNGLLCTMTCAKVFYLKNRNLGCKFLVQFKQRSNYGVQERRLSRFRGLSLFLTLTFLLELLAPAVSAKPFWKEKPSYPQARRQRASGKMDPHLQSALKKSLPQLGHLPPGAAEQLFPSKAPLMTSPQPIPAAPTRTTPRLKKNESTKMLFSPLQHATPSIPTTTMRMSTKTTSTVMAGITPVGQNWPCSLAIPKKTTHRTK